MPTILNLLPAHVPIGSTTDSTGRQLDVYMTPELARALSDLMQRIGGTVSFSTDELAALTASTPTDGAALATLQRMVLDLAMRLEAKADMSARLAAMERRLDDIAKLAHAAGPAPVDWEHPGRLGDKTPNTARVTTLNKITFTQPATAATFTLSDGKTFTATNSIALAGVDGKTFTISNTLGLSGTDGAFLNIGNGGTLGSAAYANSTSFAPAGGGGADWTAGKFGCNGKAASGPLYIGAAATDAASTQTLANALRNIVLNFGLAVVGP